MNPDRRTLRAGIPSGLGTELDGLVSTFVELPANSRRSSGPSRYRIERVLGRGALFVTFAATRIAPEGAVPFVLKVLRPSLARAWPEGPKLLSRDQAKVMAILNDRVPPSPHVVRLLEVGELPKDAAHGVDLTVPWLALEYVDGGATGTSLFDRIRHAVTHTGASIAPASLLALVHGVSRGLDWVHMHGLLHRGLSPNNVLVVGHGRDTIAKVTDVAIARPLGLPSDFGLSPGRDEKVPIVSSEPYRAPEQYTGEPLGPTVDVFALGALVRFVLTGHGPSPVDPALIDEPSLHPALRQDPERTEAIEQLLSHACSYDPTSRPATIESFWSALETHLVALLDSRYEAGSLRSIAKATQEAPARWFFSERHRPREEMELHALAPDAEGNALALGRVSRAGASSPPSSSSSSSGDRLIYFDGQSWRALGSAPLIRAPRDVASIATGQWLVIGDGAHCELLEASGWHEIARGGTALHFELAYAGTGGLVCIVGAAPYEPPSLLVSFEGAFRAPIPLEGAAAITGIARLDEAGHVLVGRAVQGGPYIAAYDQATHHVRSQRPVGSAPLSGLGSDRQGTAFAIGAHGTVIHIQRFPETVARLSCFIEQVATVDDLCAIAVGEDAVWCATAGALFRRDPIHVGGDGAHWTQAWSDDLGAPLRAIAVRPRSLLAFTSRGAVVEGRPLG